MKVIRSLALTFFIFGLLGWVYIAINAEVHPITLALPLTHLFPYPREDTFGSICFLVSMVSFFIWDVMRGMKNDPINRNDKHEKTDRS